MILFWKAYMLVGIAFVALLLCQDLTRRTQNYPIRVQIGALVMIALTWPYWVCKLIRLRLRGS
jgi:hypothetical protein